MDFIVLEYQVKIKYKVLSKQLFFFYCKSKNVMYYL